MWRETVNRSEIQAWNCEATVVCSLELLIWLKYQLLYIRIIRIDLVKLIQLRIIWNIVIPVPKVPFLSCCIIWIWAVSVRVSAILIWSQFSWKLVWNGLTNKDSSAYHIIFTNISNHCPAVAVHCYHSDGSLLLSTIHTNARIFIVNDRHTMIVARLSWRNHR